MRREEQLTIMLAPAPCGGGDRRRKEQTSNGATAHSACRARRTEGLASRSNEEEQRHSHYRGAGVVFLYAGVEA